MSNNSQNDYQPSVDQLISLRQAAQISGLSVNHMRLLVSKGIMWGKKIDTFWITTEEVVLDYISQEHKPGPKAKST